jgi:hypothetical protein
MAKSTVIQYVPVNTRLASRFFLFIILFITLIYSANLPFQHDYSIIPNLIYILCSVYQMYQHVPTGFLMLPFRDKNSASKIVFFPSGLNHIFLILHGMDAGAGRYPHTTFSLCVCVAPSNSTSHDCIVVQPVNIVGVLKNIGQTVQNMVL